MAYKRKYRSYGGSFRKRRRYSRVPRRTRFRRRSRYPTRRYKSRKGSRRMQRTYYRINGRNAKNMAPLCWRTHHATQKRTPQLMKNVMKSIGQVHYHRILAEGNTSLTTNNNPLFYRFMPSLDTSTVYSWYCTHPSAATAAWSSVSANGWGTTNYTIGTFPTGYKRMLWSHTYMRLVFDNVAENISIKVRFVRKGKAHSSSTTFSGLPIDPDEPVDQQYWHVLHEQKIVFDSPTSDTSAQHRELDYFFPWNRLIETSTKASSTALTDWMDNPYGPNNFLTMCIISDDAGLTTDSQYVAVKCFLEHKFVEID